MSDVSKTNELIAEARRQVGHIEDKSKRERLISDLADALSARQPTEDDREAIAKALCEGADTCWNDLTEQELVWHYRDAESVLAAGFSRATVPDAATELQSRADAELLRMMRNNLKHAEAERDAALAAVERVRAIHPNVNGECHTCSDENGPKRWPCDTLAALDGAPEPDNDDPCDAEVFSWDHYWPSQIDSYWIRCTLLGKHDEHEDSHTGLKWGSGLPVEGERP